jgi:hypothetical protein
LESLCKIDHLFFSVRRILNVMSTAAKFPGWPATDEDIKEQFRRAFGREMTAQERDALHIFSTASVPVPPLKT